MTPRECALYVKGKQEAIAEKLRNDITVVFQGECFAREKSLSGRTLKKALGYVEKPKPKKSPVQSEEQLWHMIRAINAGVGGTVKQKDKTYG